MPFLLRCIHGIAGNMPNLVFERLTEIHTLVSFQNAENPTDLEWDKWIAAVGENLQASPTDHRTLAVTEGGHPTRSQQLRLVALLNGRRALTAVVSSAPAPRFVVSALTFSNPDLKSFSPTEMDAALQYLRLGASERSLATAAIERLRKQLA